MAVCPGGRMEGGSMPPACPPPVEAGLRLWISLSRSRLPRMKLSLANSQLSGLTFLNPCNQHASAPTVSMRLGKPNGNPILHLDYVVCVRTARVDMAHRLFHEPQPTSQTACLPADKVHRGRAGRHGVRGPLVQAFTHVGVELPDEAGKVVVLEMLGQQVARKLRRLPHDEAAGGGRGVRVLRCARNGQGKVRVSGVCWHAGSASPGIVTAPRHHAVCAGVVYQLIPACNARQPQRAGCCLNRKSIQLAVDSAPLQPSSWPNSGARMRPST